MFKGRRRWLLVVLWIAGLAGPAPGARAQGSDSIFNRFNSGLDVAKTWQSMVEVPVAVRPQTDPNADIVANEGLNYVIAFRPENRVYFSRSFGYSRVEWQPTDRLKKVQTITFDITQILNFSIARSFVLSFGVGLGLVDGLTVERGGGFETRLEPFLPIQIGAALPLGRSLMVGAKVIQSSFFGPGPVVSMTRGLLGIGFNY